MSQGLVIVIIVALLMAAAGLLLWDFSARRQARLAAKRHLEARLSSAPAATVSLSDMRFGAPLPEPAEEAAPASALARLPVPGWAHGAVTPNLLYGGLAGIAAAFLLAWLLADAIRAAGLAVLLLVGGTFAIWLTVQKMRRELVSQLPAFLDVIVRLIVVGNSTQAAFQTAVASTKQPLRSHMDNTMALVRAGFDIDQALLQTARKVQVPEMFLLSAIIGLGVRYGGRSDALLERVANFIRDREESEEELAALSAETRLSAWVLGLLPVVVGGFIMIVNGDYFARLWDDPTGRNMVYGAAALQLAGVVLLYRLARLD